jgi:hypothetical protein
MDLVFVVAILLVLDVLVALFGVDSRPGFAGGRTEYRERWFIHEHHD